MLARWYYDREERQRVVNGWVARAFGRRFLTVHNRMERMFEEVGELGQALDFPEERAIEVVRKAYAGKKGVPSQEVGGVSICLLSLCEVLDYSADECEKAEVRRVLTKPAAEFQAKLRDKLASGICTDEPEIEEAA